MISVTLLQTSKMEYVVDFQWFRDDGNNYIIKELSVQPIKNAEIVNVSELYLFLPPFDCKHLSQNTKKINEWITKNLGLSWNCGIKEYSELQPILNRLINGKCIYVKGPEKK